MGQKSIQRSHLILRPKKNPPPTEDRESEKSKQKDVSDHPSPQKREEVTKPEIPADQPNTDEIPPNRSAAVIATNPITINVRPPPPPYFDPKGKVYESQDKGEADLVPVYSVTPDPMAALQRTLGTSPQNAIDLYKRHL